MFIFYVFCTYFVASIDFRRLAKILDCIKEIYNNFYAVN